MRLMKNRKYTDTIEKVLSVVPYSEQLRGKTFLISGATGMIGSFLIDLLMMKNKVEGLDLTIIALGRDEKKAKDRFLEYWNSGNFLFCRHSMGEPLTFPISNVDYILHLASSTHPLQYSSDPVGTLLINIEGLKELLDFGRNHGLKRFLFASSVEIYGENRGDVDRFKEDYMGYIDCNTLRACYPEGKRASEALCQGYIAQYGLDIVIARFARVYGPTMLRSDSKAIAQFLKKGIAGENIVLKSEGNQLYSYCHVADTSTAILKILFEGKKGDAYNVADEASEIMLKDLAAKIASFKDADVVFEVPDEKERKGYSTATVATLDTKKLGNIGWKPMISLDEGLKDTLAILDCVWRDDQGAIDNS